MKKYKIREVDNWGAFHYEAFIAKKWVKVTEIKSLDVYESSRSGNRLAIDNVYPIMKSVENSVTEQGIGTYQVRSNRIFVELSLNDFFQKVTVPLFDLQKIQVEAYVEI